MPIGERVGLRTGIEGLNQFSMKARAMLSRIGFVR